jgi:hypothetical protein
MIYESGFAALRKATFTGEKLSDDMHNMARMAEEAGADECEVTLGYDKGAKPGDLVPEIVLRVRAVSDPDEDSAEGEE